MTELERAHKRAASHEAGHAIVAVALGGGFDSIEIAYGPGLFVGAHIFFNSETYELTLEARTIAHMGGLAGERANRRTPGAVYVDGVVPATVEGEDGDIAVVHEDISLAYALPALSGHPNPAM